MGKNCNLKTIKKRLRMYEDTELTPDEIKQLQIDNAKLAALDKVQQEVITKLKAENAELKELIVLAVEDIPHVCETCNVENRIDKDCFCNQNLNPNTYIHTAWKWQHQDRLDKILEVNYE